MLRLESRPAGLERLLRSPAGLLLSGPAAGFGPDFALRLGRCAGPDDINIHFERARSIPCPTLRLYS